MKVLIISANKMNFSPSGPAYIAGAARKAGHTVKVFDCLFADNVNHELKLCLPESRDRDCFGKNVKKMHRGYSVAQIRKSLSCLSNSDIPYGVSLLLGAPGETIDTIKETFSVIDSFPVPSLSITIGINFWTHHQPVLADLLKKGEISTDENLFAEIHYISHELPKEFMIDLIHNLNERKNCSVYVFRPYAQFQAAMSNDV